MEFLWIVLLPLQSKLITFSSIADTPSVYALGTHQRVDWNPRFLQQARINPTQITLYIFDGNSRCSAFFIIEEGKTIQLQKTPKRKHWGNRVLEQQH
jgi:hypothetical protein